MKYRILFLLGASMLLLAEPVFGADHDAGVRPLRLDGNAGDSAQSLRPASWRFGVEGGLGGGINDNLSRVEPPEGFPFTLGRGGFAFEIRTRLYFKRVGAQISFEDVTDPLSFEPDSLGHMHQATSWSAGFVASVHTELFDHHWRVEPIIGFAIRRESATSWDYPGKSEQLLFDAKRTETGPVLGLEQTILLQRRLQLHHRVTLAMYPDRDIRTKIAVQYVFADYLSSRHATESSPPDDLGGFISMGLHLAWKDDNRHERLIILGFGVGIDAVLSGRTGGRDL